jgi:hypothetical protein
MPRYPVHLKGFVLFVVGWHVKRGGVKFESRYGCVAQTGVERILNSADRNRFESGRAQPHSTTLARSSRSSRIPPGFEVSRRVGMLCRFPSVGISTQSRREAKARRLARRGSAKKSGAEVYTMMQRQNDQDAGIERTGKPLKPLRFMFGWLATGLKPGVSGVIV